jgi:hypothetical protein
MTGLSDAQKLRGDLDQAVYDDFCNRPYWRFGDEDYELADTDLGEPFLLVRRSDGKQFEVELGAEVREVTP